MSCFSCVFDLFKISSNELFSYILDKNIVTETVSEPIAFWTSLLCLFIALYSINRKALWQSIVSILLFLTSFVIRTFSIFFYIKENLTLIIIFLPLFIAFLSIELFESSEKKSINGDIHNV